MAFNAAWAKENPNNEEVGRATQIDYVRRYLVLPRDSALPDPPSALPLNLKMDGHLA